MPSATINTRYDRPDRLEDALVVRAETGARVIAGCTDVLPATEAKVVPGHVLDITRIPDLRGITQLATGLRIGATTTWTDIVKAKLPPACAALQLAAREVGAMQIQNRGTIAGNLCNASPAADGVPPLLVLDADIELSSVAGPRRMPLAEFISGPRQTALRDDEILTAIHIPGTALHGQGHFLKLGARAYLVISIAMVAARIELTEGRIASAALAVGSCGPVATRLSAVEQALIGAAPKEAAAHITDTGVAASLAPIDDVRADAGYRSGSAAELVRRCVACAAAQTEEPV